MDPQETAIPTVIVTDTLLITAAMIEYPAKAVKDAARIDRMEEPLDVRK